MLSLNPVMVVGTQIVSLFAQSNVSTRAIRCFTFILTFALTVKHVFLNAQSKLSFTKMMSPEGQESYIQLNAEKSEECPNITERKAPLKDD